MKLKKGVTYVIAILFLAVLSLAGVSQRYEMLPVGILVVSLFGAGISALFGLFTRRYTVSRIFGCLFAIAIFSIVVSGIIGGFQQRATEAAAVPLIAAIESYHTLHGDYPASLDELVPAQLAVVPRTRLGFGGTPFFYRRTDGTFRLGYSLPAFMVRRYDSATHKWTIRD